MSGWQAALIEISRSTATYRIPNRARRKSRDEDARCWTVPPAYNTRIYEWPPPRIYYDVCISIIIGCSLSVPAGWRSPIYDFIAVRAGGAPRIRRSSLRARLHPLLLLFLSFSDYGVANIGSEKNISLPAPPAFSYSIYSTRILMSSKRLRFCQFSS